MSYRTVCILALALSAISGTAAAQDGARTLHWRRIDVDARLDAAGRLRVIERQAMVFTGDWNGGERTFNLRPGQQLDLNGITRIDPDGTGRALQRGDLDAVDEFDWTSSKTLRWRSRLPADPPFDNQQIIYELDYTLSNILVADGEGYQLDHDFAFPDRAGVIENFSLAFAAADDWRSATTLPLRLARTSIPPGASVVVTIPLQYIGAGHPAGVARGLSLATRVLLALMLVGVVGAMLRRFFAEEKARGRFEPIVPAESVDQEWLSRHVFNLPPEVVGAAWDNTTSAPEVAAMIARMVLEGKLASRVESERRKHILHLELKVPRAELSGDERTLVDALFDSGRDQTHTERIKQRYETSGFDPAKLIGEGIKKQIHVLTPNRQTGIDWGRVMINVAVVLLVVVAGLVALRSANRSLVTAAPILVAFLGLIALGHAAMYRADVVHTKRRARMTVFLLLAAARILALTLGLLESGAALSLTPMIAPANVGLSLVTALVVMFFGIAFLVLRAARTREDPERLQLRRTLAAGRAFFMRELRKPQPKLDDAWFPYLLAFGLGKHIDKWFRAFGAAHDTGLTGVSAAAVASTSGSSWSGGGPLFGGGGGFGGGGAGRTWAASVTTLSAGVAAPSSSGSGGGGGGGGGSSGGGGGGGW